MRKPLLESGMFEDFHVRSDGQGIYSTYLTAQETAFDVEVERPNPGHWIVMVSDHGPRGGAVPERRLGRYAIHDGYLDGGWKTRVAAESAAVPVIRRLLLADGGRWADKPLKRPGDQSTRPGRQSKGLRGQIRGQIRKAAKGR